MATNKKSSSLVKSIIAIVLVLGISAGAYLYFGGCKCNCSCKEVVEETVATEQTEEVMVERLTKEELEASINNTLDGMVPEEIINRFSPNTQRVIVKNDPDANIASGISEVWLLMFMEMYSNITVVEEECVYDSLNRLETLVIIAE